MTTRIVMNFWLDVLSLLVMLCLIATGGLIYFVLPPGTGHSHHLFGFGRHDFGEIHFYLAVAAVVLLALHVALHWSWICGVVGKVLGISRPSPKVQRTWGLSLLLGIPVLIGIGLWWASGLVEQAPGSLLARGDHAIQRQRIDMLADKSNDGEGTLANMEPNTQERTKVSSYDQPTKLARESRGHDKHVEDCPAGAAISGRTTLLEAVRICGSSVAQMCDHLGMPVSVDSGQRLGRLKRSHGLSIHAVRRLACDG